MKKSARLVFIFFVSVAAVHCNHSESTLSCQEVLTNYYRYLNELNSESKINEIISQMNRVIKKDPSCVYPYLVLGDIYFSLKQYQTSKFFFLKAYKINPENIYAMFKVGIILQNEKKFDSALIFFSTAAQEKTVGGFAINKTKGLESITNVPNFDVDYTEIIFNSAKSDFNANHLTNAMHELNYCIRMNYNLGESSFLRGLIYLKVNDTVNACQDMSLASENGYTEAGNYVLKYCKKSSKMPGKE